MCDGGCIAWGRGCGSDRPRPAAPAWRRETLHGCHMHADVHPANSQPMLEAGQFSGAVGDIPPSRPRQERVVTVITERPCHLVERVVSRSFTHGLL